MSDIVERLRARQVTNWVHATGQTPRASGKRTDPLCAAAADEIERLRAEVAGLQIKADLFDLAVRKGLLSVHSELIDPRNHGTRCSWLEGHAKACDISNNAALAARKVEA